MEMRTLKKIRFFVPGVILIIFYSILGWVTNLWEPFPTDNLNDLLYGIPVIIICVLYYSFNLTALSNRWWYDDVNENLRLSLVKISELKDEREIYTWQKLRVIFYKIVDNDISLSIKSERVYWNGLFWTSIADVRASAFIFIILSLVILSLGIGKAAWALVLYTVLFSASFFLSNKLTKKHKELGNEQMEMIEHFHKEQIKRELEEIANRSNS